MPCPRCDDLDLDKIFANNLIPCRQYGFPVAKIEELSRSCRRARCLVCRFLASSTSLMDTCVVADTWHLRAFDIDTIMTEQVQSDMITLQKLVLVLIPGPGDEELEFEVNESDIIVPTNRVTDQRFTNHVAGPTGRILNEKRVSWDLIKTWLDTCINHHNVRCTAKLTDAQLRNMISTIQVIDCRDGSIVPFDGSGFVALSYCIGPRKRKRSFQSQTSKQTRHRAKVVVDAIECTKKLGYRYLWVDQVCIDQNDKTVLQETISKMNLIYSQAVLTIASLAPTQNDGLPGVLNVLRQQQPCLQTETTTYVSTMHSLAVAVNKSKWTSRAWCYQEAVLSKRLLIFSSQQVYFVCNSSHLSEALTCSTERHNPALTGLRPSEYVAAGTSVDGSLVQDEEEWSFGAWLAAFTTRDITFQNDVLNAFRGILNISGHRSFWGVPFIIDNRSQQGDKTYSNLAEAFARGLSWSTSYNSDRFVETRPPPTSDDFYSRKDFPSWSWASCRTYCRPVRYQIPGGFAAEYSSHMDMNNASVNLKIEVEISPSTSISISEYVHASNNSKIMPESSRHIHITTDTVNLGMCQVHVNPRNDTDTSIAKFCIRLEGETNETAAVDSIMIESQVFEETPNELEDGRFIIDFDKPITTQSGNLDDLRHERFLGLILFQRVLEDDVDDNDGEYCVMLVQQLNNATFWVRAGIVWIAADHMEMLSKQKKRICMG